MFAHRGAYRILLHFAVRRSFRFRRSTSLVRSCRVNKVQYVCSDRYKIGTNTAVYIYGTDTIARGISYNVYSEKDLFGRSTSSPPIPTSLQHCNTSHLPVLHSHSAASHARRAPPSRIRVQGQGRGTGPLSRVQYMYILIFTTNPPYAGGCRWLAGFF